MDRFEGSHTQMCVVRLPLYTVTLATVARVSTPLLAILHWHGQRRATPLHLRYRQSTLHGPAASDLVPHRVHVRPWLRSAK
jgi:hypothetical protein